MEAAGPLVVVMGVSGCGKSTVGELIAAGLGAEFLEGDSLHPPQNIERMAAGIALTDADRDGWLQAIGEQMASRAAQGRTMVVSCSALKRAYRDTLRRAVPGLVFVHVAGARALIAQRLAARKGHYMPPSLLDSQFAALEPPGAGESALTVDLTLPPETMAAHALAWLRQSGARTMSTFTKVILFTDADGRARWREESIALGEGTPQARLSALMASGGLQLRESPVGFRSSFHCTVTPQWVFILRGRMEIFLQDGSSRVFGPGEHFYSADTVPEGVAFDAAKHGHWSRQVGDEPLQTLFVRG